MSMPFDYRNVMLANNLMRFADNTFAVFKDAIVWVASYISPESRTIITLRGVKPEIDNFIKESQIMTNECNKGAFVNPSFRLRYWVNVMKAYEIQRMLVGLPNSNVSVVLHRMCNDVIKQGKENMADLRCSPIKYEPYVVCIEGSAGIGKSMLVQNLAKDMLHAIGITEYSGDPLYYRISGSKHWNGYSDQPVVIYDDWMNITDSQIVAQVLNELYQLKSCATFVPEQAAIEDKKIKATPRLVILLCNEAFPDSVLTNLVSCKRAVYRRRDVLVKSQLKVDFQDRNLRNLTVEESTTIAHLEFLKYLDPLSKESLTGTAIGYREFSDFMIESFKVYNAQELNNVKRRTDNLLTFFSNTTINLRDPFAVFYQAVDYAVNDNLILQSDRLEESIQDILQGLDTMHEHRFMPVPEDPINPWAQIDASTLATTLLGVSIAVPAAALVFRKAADMFRKIIGAQPVWTCSICMENRPIAFVCAGAWRTITTPSMEGLHSFCESCYQRTPRPYKCGVCRNEEVPLRVMPVEYYKTVSLIVQAYKLVDKGDNFLTNLITYFKEHHGPEIWMGISGTITMLSSAFLKWRVHTGTATLPILFYTATNALQHGFSCYFVAKLARVELGSAHAHIPVDITAGRKIPMFVSFSDEASEFLIRAVNFNENHNFVSDDFLRLQQEGEELKERFLGSDFSLYLPRLGGIFWNTEVATLNKDIDNYNAGLIHFKKTNTLEVNLQQCLSRRSVLVNRKNSIQPPRIEAQMNNGPTEYSSPYPVHHFSRYDLSNDLPYEFDVRGVPVLETRDVNVCPHKPFATHLESVRYEDGVYSISCQQGFAGVEIFRCGLHPDCPFQDVENVCRLFFNRNKAMWFSWIINLDINTQVEAIKRKLPKYAWPSWIVMEPVVLDMPCLTGENWWDFTNLNPVLKKILTALAIGAGALIVLKSVTGIYNLLAPCSQIIPSGDATIRHFRPKAERIVRGKISAQSEMQSAIIDKINANFFSIVVEIDGVADKYLNGVGIRQRLGIIPKHYFEYMVKVSALDNVKFYLAKPFDLRQRVELSFNKSDFMCSETADICVYQLPQSCNMFKDIVRYMVTDDDLQRKIANTGVIVKPPIRVSGITSVIPLEIKGYERRKFILDKNNGYTSEHCLSYNFSQAGACGSLVLKDHSQRPIIAMHIAGVGDAITGIGYGVILTQETFAEFQCEISGKAQEYEEVDFLQDIDNTRIYLPVDSVVTYEGVLPKDKVPYSPHKSKIKKSLIHKDLPWKSAKEPAILSSSDPRYQHTISPLVAGAAKHGYLTKNMDVSEMNRIAQIRSYQLNKAKPSVVPTTKLSVQEAIVGFESIPFYDPLHLDTSAGWPLCTNSKTLKKDYCVIDRNEEGRVTAVALDKVVLDQVARETDLRLKGIVPLTLFVDTLKDENRERAKLLKLGGTRVFCASPFSFSICMRQVFLHFAAAYMANRWELKHAVGINLQGPECTELVSRLLSKGSKIVTIDYSNFGPGFNAGIARVASNNIKKWIIDKVSEVTEEEVDCLIEENLNSAHALNHLVYRQMGGSPSGSPITVIINSEVNITYVMMAWNNLVTDENKWMEFEENVCLYVYGDDLIMSVSDKYIERFNGKTITQFFATYNIAATDASKSAEVQAWTGIEEASFLKCCMKPHPTRHGQWIAQLDMNSVQNTPMWIKEEVDFKGATRVNAEAGVRAAYGYGKEFFDNYQLTINEALIKRNIEPILLDWGDLDNNFYDI